MRFSADTPLGHVETTETVQLEDKVSVLLTSEKPIYQPSQTIHLRALALNRADRHAAGGRAVTFEVEDPRGNKVFRKGTATDNFGVASAEFTLADEVNLGAYHIRAKLGEARASNAELTVNVERYVLPKFRVTIEFDSKNGKPKRDYQPGDHVTGAVKANYFFGKPMDNASVTIKASAMDVGAFRSGISKGRTDRDGDYRFDLSCPILCRQREAPWCSAGRGRGHGERCGGALGDTRRADYRKPGIPTGYGCSRRRQVGPGTGKRSLYSGVLPRRNAGQSGPQVRVGDARLRVKTDEAGIAQFGSRETSEQRTAYRRRRPKGNRVSENLTLETRPGEDQVLVRTSHAVYKPGDRMDIACSRRG